MSDIQPEDLRVLAEWDTPTICNGLEVIDATLIAKGFTTKTLYCARPTMAPIVGFARTATIRSRKPTTRNSESQRKMQAKYYRHMAEPPGPTIAIIQDIDCPSGLGAWWGEVHTTVHRALGVAGVVSNGSARDLDANTKDFQLLVGSISPSHAHVHVVDVDCDVEVCSMEASPGDIIHADKHGAVRIPPDTIRELPQVIKVLMAKEKTILDATKEHDFKVERLLEVMGLQ